MKLGESGEAFFVEELSLEDEALPKHLVCSPIPYSENPEQLESESAVWIPMYVFFSYPESDLLFSL